MILCLELHALDYSMCCSQTTGPPRPSAVGQPALAAAGISRTCPGGSRMVSRRVLVSCVLRFLLERCLRVCGVMRSSLVSKETYYSVKRDLLLWLYTCDNGVKFLVTLFCVWYGVW